MNSYPHDINRRWFIYLYLYYLNVLVSWALGQNYFGIQYAAAFFDRFIAKTYRYVSAFLSQGRKVEVVVEEMDAKQARLFSLLDFGKYMGNR